MRALVAVVLLLCLAVGAWFVFDREELQPPPSAPGAAATSDEPVAQPVAASRPQSASPLTAPQAEAQTREAVAPRFAGQAGEVQVVSHATKAPIAEATVYCTPPDLDWQKLSPELQELGRTDQEAFQRRVGPTLTTDTEGCCRVPLGKFGTPVTAVKDALWGQVYVAKDAKGPTVLVLRPDCTLRVLVVDAGGSPAAGAKVLGKRKEGDQPMTWHMGATDDRGRYEQRHIQQYAGNDGVAKIELAAGIPGGESAPVAVDVTAPPPEIVLHLPTGGTVTVRVLDAEGQPMDPSFLGNPLVRLATFTERPTTANAENDGLNLAQDGVALDAGGVAVFGTVAFDRFVLANVSWTLRSAPVPGPTREKPQLEVMVRESKDDVVLTGTLLDAKGRPLASSGYQATCTYRNGMSSQSGRTDGAGRFRITMGQLRAGTVTVGFDTRFANSADPLAAELPPRDLTKGRNDLGEVRLAAHSILVQGRVVGVAGSEPPPVQLQIERQCDGRWQQEHNLPPEWGAAGAFTMRSGMAKGTPIRLTVQATGFLPVTPIECAAGDTGLEINLRTGGSARATFLVDASLPLERLTVRFQPTDPHAPRDPRAEMMERMHSFPGQQQAKDGRLQRDWQGLTAGSYRLQALCAGIAEPLVAIDAVEVADGPCADPRLVDIDLRGRVRAFEVRATGSDGKPIASPEAFVVTRSKGDDWCGFHLGRGFVTIAAPAPVDLIVVAKGHKTAFVNGVSDPRTIPLEAASEAQVVLELPVPLPEGVTLRLRLQPALELPRQARVQLDNGRGMGADSFFVEETVVDAAGKATVPVRYPGPYTVEATVSRGPGGGSYIRDLEPRKITLPAAGAVAVRVGQKGLETAVERLRR